MFSILGHRKIWFFFSGGLILLSLFSFFFFGLNLSIDFTGGTRTQVHFADRPSAESFQDFFQTTFGTEKNESISEVLGTNDLLVRSKTLSEQDLSLFSENLQKIYPGSEVLSVYTIGSSVGTVFRERAMIAVSLAVLAIVLFVAFAFRTVPEGYSSWKFSIATLAALIHDIVVLVGFFAILNAFLGNEVDSLFVTALLTILGYSVNDTIIIFDRIRENLIKNKTYSFEQVVENALWKTMYRSLNTSFSTLLMVMSMIFFFLGFDSLFSFFLALSLGMIVGTYSSLFITAPLLFVWHKK